MALYCMEQFRIKGTKLSTPGLNLDIQVVKGGCNRMAVGRPAVGGGDWGGISMASI